MSEAHAVADLLIFDIGAEQFALSLPAVRQVLDSALVHRDRRVFDDSVGVLRSGATFIPIFEPSRALGASCRAVDPVVLLLEHAGAHVGLLVDHAEASLAVSAASARDLSGLGSLDGVVLGALRPADRWVTLLDAGALVEALLDRRSSHAA